MYLAYVVITLTILLMLVLINKTDILKDTGGILTDQKPYSLARTQLALWTTIIFCSLVYLWGTQDFIFNEKVTLGKTALILLGISTSTAVFGKAIDESDKKNLANRNIQSMHQNDPSQGFLLDILSDKDGISIVRFQNVLFTLVLMLAFLFNVARMDVMPEFDNTFLVLSGISTTGYLGIKMNENRKS